MMKKKDVVAKLAEETNMSEEKCIIVNDVLENHFIIGRNNKDKIVADFVEKLDMSEEEANKLYNKCAELIVKGVFKR